MLRRKLAARLHDLRIAGIEGTAPLTSQASGLLYLGMTCHRDARAWLVAVKSVATGIGPGQFATIDDGSLTAADRRMLARHLPGLRILSFGDIPTEGFPSGGCWERLLGILELTRDFYVIQVDADLAAQAPLTEAAAAVRDNRGFTLAGEPSSRLMSATESSEQARCMPSDHVQSAAEQLLGDLPDAHRLRYVRGCAGFAGFPKGCNRAALARFSQFMQSRLGALWQKWGSEQVASNFVIANTDDAIVLPWTRYPAFGLELNVGSAALVHFIGPHRYDAGVFTRMSRAAIARLA